MYFRRTSLALLGLALSLQAGTVTTTNPCISPSDGSGAYDISTQLYPGGFAIPSDLVLAPTDCVNLSDATSNPQNVTFDANVNGVLAYNNGSNVAPIGGTAVVGVIATYTGTTDGTDDYNLQMTSLSLTGLPLGAEIRIDPVQISAGAATVTNNGDGTFRISSFFDIFTDLSLDGGNTWAPGSGGGPGGSAIATLDPTAPEPATLALMGAAIVLIGAARFRKRQ